MELVLLLEDRDSTNRNKGLQSETLVWVKPYETSDILLLLTYKTSHFI